MIVINKSDSGRYFQFNATLESINLPPGETEVSDELFALFQSRIEADEMLEVKTSDLSEITEPAPPVESKLESLNEPGRRGRKPKNEESKDNSEEAINE